MVSIFVVGTGNKLIPAFSIVFTEVGSSSLITKVRVESASVSPAPKTFRIANVICFIPSEILSSAKGTVIL